MIDLGMKGEPLGFTSLNPLTIAGRPTVMPELAEKQEVLCGYNVKGRGERMIVCDNLKEMQKLYDSFSQSEGIAKSISWYIGTT